MARLTKTEAARQLGIARSTLYKLIDQGTVSPTPDGLLDPAELVRVAASVDMLKGRPRTSADSRTTPAAHQAETPHGRPQTPDRERPQTASGERPQTSADVLVDILREQISVLRDELQEARQSAQAAREREALLLQMLQEQQHRYDRLLDIPRQTHQDAPGPPQHPRRVPHRPTPPDAPTGQPGAAGRDARGAMRRRILEVLQSHPEGMTSAQLQIALGVERSLTDTCIGMVRYGLLRRVGRGRYMAATP